MDAVLIIGEHGNYPRNEKGQVLYPRYEFFEQCVKVFEQDGRAVPVYNDKHLSYSFEKAKAMVDASRRLRFPMLAGSSLPVTWRLAGDRPAAGLRDRGRADGRRRRLRPHGFPRARRPAVHGGTARGGETGVKAVQLIEGDAVWKAGDEGRYSKELLTAALSRSDTPLGLTDTDGRTQDLVASGELRKLAKNPAAYFIEYRDGLKATMLMLNGAIKDFNFAARVKGNGAPQILVHAIPADAGAERHLFRMPDAQGGADVRNRRGAVSGGADAAGQRHAGKLPDVEGAGARAAGDAASECGVQGASTSQRSSRCIMPR